MVDAVARNFGLILDTLGSVVAYREEWHGVNSAALRFSGHINGEQLESVDILHWDAAGLFTDITIMARPLAWLQWIGEGLQAQLSGG